MWKSCTASTYIYLCEVNIGVMFICIMRILIAYWALHVAFSRTRKKQIGLFSILYFKRKKRITLLHPKQRKKKWKKKKSICNLQFLHVTFKVLKSFLCCFCSFCNLGRRNISRDLVTMMITKHGNKLTIPTTLLRGLFALLPHLMLGLIHF